MLKLMDYIGERKMRAIFDHPVVPHLLELPFRLKLSKEICWRNLAKELLLRARKLCRQKLWKRRYLDTLLRIGPKI
jgi:transposase